MYFKSAKSFQFQQKLLDGYRKSDEEQFVIAEGGQNLQNKGQINDIMELFNLLDPNSDESASHLYFQNKPVEEFWSIIQQAGAKSHKKELFKYWFQELYGQINDTPLRKKMFDEWIEEDGNHDKWGFEFADKPQQEKYQHWLKEKCDQRHEYVMRKTDLMTDRLIWNVLEEADQKGYIERKSYQELVHFRNVAFDLFHLLDDDHDNLLRKYRYDFAECEWYLGDIDQDFWKLMKACVPDSKNKQFVEWIQEVNKLFKKHIDFRLFQEMLWTGHVEHGLDYKKMQTLAYNQNSRCFKFCKNRRAKQMRLMMTGKLSELKSNPFQQLLNDALHILDIYTDLSLAYTMYKFSRQEVEVSQDNTKFVYDYNICFVWISLATFGPYLIQYASQMNLLYQKGVFQDQNLKRLGCIKSLSLVAQMSFFGVLLIPIIDVFNKLQTLFSILLLPFSCCKIKGRGLNQIVYDRMTLLVTKLSEMNEYEISNFKQQSKYAQMIFEDLPMLVLDALVVVGILKVPKVKQGAFTSQALAMQLGSTCISIYTALKELFKHSDALGEDRMEYLLVCLKAKQSWIPFGTQIEKNILKHDLHYGKILMKSYGLIFSSDSVGTYKQFNFQFSDLTIKLLAKHLMTAQLDKDLKQRNQIENDDESDNKSESQKGSDDQQNEDENLEEIDPDEMEIKKAILECEPFFQFGSSLDSLTAHSFLSFIEQNMHRLENQFILDDVNWHKLVQNSIKEKKMFDKQEGHPLTDFGKPLLQVCIESYREKDDEEIRKWPLRELMRLLLLEYKCDPNNYDQSGNTPLFTLCIQQDNRQAMQMILDLCKDTLDINIPSKPHNITAYGRLIQQPNTHVQMLKPLVSQIDYHKVQTNYKGWVMTPIASFIVDVEPEKLDHMFSWDCYKEVFPDKNFTIQTEQEIDELLYYSINKKKIANICEELFQQIKDPKLMNYYNKKRKQEKIEFPHKGEKLQKKRKDINTQNMEEFDETKVNSAANGVNLCFLAVLLSLFIEISSCFDFFSDLLIIVELGKSTDTAWFTFSLFTVLAPYYTVYSSLINQLIKLIRQNESVSESSKCSNFFSYVIKLIMILPTMLVFLIALDIFYMNLSVVVYPVLFSLSLFKIGQTLFDAYESCQNRILHKLFGLSQMEVQGFRSQRTILQFQLESIPQIIFQIYLLIRLKQLKRSGDQYGVSESAVQFSVCCAIVHVLFEIISLKVESITSNTPFFQYVVTCYNARDRWIPRQINFQNQEVNDNQWQLPPIEIDEAGIFCGGKLGFKVGFKFTEQSIESLIQVVSNMTHHQNKQRLKKLLIDDCFKEIAPMKLMQLAITGNQKITLCYTSKQFQRIEKSIQNDQQLVEKLRNPRELDKDSREYLILSLANTNQWKFINIFMDLHADFSVSSKIYELGDTFPLTVIKRAFYNDKFEIVTKLHEQREERGLVDLFKTSFAIMVRYFDPILIGCKKPLQKQWCRMMTSLCFDTQKMFDFISQCTIVNQMSLQISQGNQHVAYFRHLMVWGSAPFCREIQYFTQLLMNCKDVSQEKKDNMKKFLEEAETYCKMLPDKVTVINGFFDRVLFPSAFLSQFILIRKKFFESYIVNFDPNEFPKEIDLAQICQNSASAVTTQDLQLFKNVMALQEESLDLDQVERLDRLVAVLGFDKERAVYFRNSRQLLASAEQSNAVFSAKTQATRWLNYVIPDNVIAFKSIKIYKMDKDIQTISFMYGGMKFMNEKKFQKFAIEKLNIGDGDRLFLSTDYDFYNLSADQMAANTDKNAMRQIIKFIETMKNFVCAGQTIEIYIQDTNKTPSKFNYEFEFYKKIKNGNFVEESKQGE